MVCDLHNLSQEQFPSGKITKKVGVEMYNALVYANKFVGLDKCIGVALWHCTHVQCLLLIYLRCDFYCTMYGFYGYIALIFDCFNLLG